MAPPRAQAYEEEHTNVQCQDIIDELNESHDVALLQWAKYLQGLKC